MVSSVSEADTMMSPGAPTLKQIKFSKKNFTLQKINKTIKADKQIKLSVCKYVALELIYFIHLVSWFAVGKHQNKVF